MRKLYMDLVTDNRAIRLIRLIYFLADTSDLLTMEDVATALSVTKKTLKNDLALLQDYSPTVNGFVQVKKETLLFNRNSEYTIEEILSAIIGQQPLFTLLGALLDDERCSLEEWCDRIWLSERTLRRYLPILTDMLERYDLKLQVAPYLSLIGDESNIRYLYFDYLSQRGWREEDIQLDKKILQFYYDFQRSFDKTHHEALMVDGNQAKIWIHVILQRINKKKYITQLPELEQLAPTSERLEIFSQIYRAAMDECFAIKYLPEEECKYLYIAVLSMVIYLPFEEETYLGNIMRKAVSQRKIEHTFELGENFLFDSNRIDELYEFVHSFLDNISLLTRITPLFQRNSYELNQYAQTEYPILYKKCLTRLKKIKLPNQAKMVYPEDIATNLTLLFSSYLLDKGFENNKKVLFSITGEACYVSHLIMQLKKGIPSNFNTIWMFNEKITEDYVKDENIDVLIHNHVMLEPIQACQNIKVSDFPSKGEIEQLNKRLSELV